MSSAKIAQSDQINNHEVQSLIEKTTKLLKLSITQGINAQINPKVYKLSPKKLTIGGHTPKEYSSVALVVADHIKDLTPQKKKSLRLGLGRDSALTTSIRSNGINMRSEKSVVDQANVKTLFSFVNKKTFSETAMKRMVADLSVPTGQGVTLVREAALSDLRAVSLRYGTLFHRDWLKDLPWRFPVDGGAVMNNGVRFRVHEVKCVDETNPEWWGSDEITWGGLRLTTRGRQA